MNIDESFEWMLDNVQDAIFLVDVDHTGEQPRFTYKLLNDTYEEKTGLLNEHLAGKTPHELFDAGMADELIENYRRCVNKRQTHRYVEQLDLPKGSGIWKTKLTPKIEEDQVVAILGATRDITERKVAEDRQQSQKEFLKTVNDQLPGVTFQFRRDPDGSYSFPYMSEGLYDLCGVSRETAMEDAMKAFKQGYHEDLESLLESIETSAANMSKWEYEFRMNHPEKNIKWVRGSSIPEKRDDGTIVWSGVIMDVTNEKQKEIELNRQKVRFETLFDEAPIGILEEDWSDAKTFIEQIDVPDEEDLRTHLEAYPEIVREAVQRVDVQLYNKTIVDITGAKNKEHLHDNFSKLLTDDLYESVRNELIGMQEGIESFSSIFTLHRFDGEERHILRDLHLVPEFKNDWSKVFVSYRDITDRKHMEQSLRQSEERYRTLFEKVNEAFLIVSFEDEILEVNNNACELLGYSRDELSGFDLDRIIPSELLEEIGDDGIVRSRMNQHGRSIIYSYFLNRDSTRIPVEISRAPIKFGDKDAVVLSIRDRSELEQVRRKNQRKSTFVSQVTHDLRTPLNSVTGMARLLMDTNLTGEQQNYLQTILNASRNMERLTNDILDLNRIERGELILEEEPFHVQQLLGEVISLYSQKVDNRDVMMSTQGADEVPDRLVGDPDRLKQILHNLVDNAIKHTRQGSIQIAVDQETRKGSSIVLSFSVSDTGKGIPDTKLEEIFEEHQQVEPTQTGSGKGLGIGLAICRNLVEQMNGDIEVESGVGEGTTFTFRVELGVADNDEEAATVALDEVNVLIAEDNELVRNVFRTYLEAQELQVVECDSGQAALEEFTSEQPKTYDVVFLDQRLGDMTGVEVLRQVTERSEAIDSEQVYIVSGDPPEQVQSLLDTVTCAGILEKPIDGSDLTNAISSVLLERGQREGKKEIQKLKEELQSQLPESPHILVADDDHNTRILLKELLDPVVDELTLVATGEEALERRFNSPSHIILMDLEMPEMDGLEATELIRQKEKERDLSPVPIITQTAKAMKHVESKCLEAGADKFIRKPINKRRLYRSMLDVLMAEETV